MDAAALALGTPEGRRAIRRSDAGTVIRLVRQARALTQAQVGQIVGYSASAISRIERGRMRLHDVTVLRRLAEALYIRPEVLGVTAASRDSGATVTTSLTPTTLDSDGGVMQRRRLLVDAASLAGGTLLPIVDAFAAPHHSGATKVLTALERACFAPADPPGTVTSPGMNAMFDVARRRFAAGDYIQAGHQLADVVAAGQVLAEERTDVPDGQILLAHSYALATEVLIKIGGAGVAPITADRAIAAARVSGSPLAHAVATRQLVTVMRHAGRVDTAAGLALAATDRLRREGAGGPSEVAYHTRMLCTTAYVAAAAGNRDLALDLIDEADQSATRGSAAGHAGPSRFDSAAVTVYRIGVHYMLGDSGAAVAAATRVRPAQLPTAERRARYWSDVARAWDQFGNPERTFYALLAAWRQAPEEIRDRSSMRALVASLLPYDRQLPRLRNFAKLVGVTT